MDRTDIDKNDRMLKIIVIVCLALIELASLGLFPIFYSHWFYITNNDPDYTRYSFIALSIIFLGVLSFMIAIGISLYIVSKSLKQNIFIEQTVRALKWIGNFLGITGILVLSFYCLIGFGTEGGVDPGNFFFLPSLAFVFIVGLLLFHFIGALFQKAVDYRKENDLTV